MREIKFRAWDKKACRFVWSGPIQNFPTINDDDMVLSYKWEKGRLIKTLSCMDDLIWMEHTGLRDRAGQEIYEGDIVNIFKSITSMMGNQNVRVNAVVRFIAAAFRFDSGDGATAVHSSSNIIGNIYENPELLEK